jgi:MGT family glycosyltransferase
MIPALLEEVQAEQPDYILYDSMTPWGKMIGDYLSLPTISSMSIFALHPRMFMQSLEMFSILKLMIANFGRLQEYNRKAAVVERDLGVKPLDFVSSLNSASALTLVYTSSLFQPNSELFGDGYKFVGPMISARPQDKYFPFDQLDGRPVLYISMGTVNNNVLPFYQQCLAAFDGGDYQVIMSIGGQINLADLGNIPENFIIRRHVPQLEVLQYTDVFITHGGMNSVHEALSNNVPLIVIPQTDEQGLVAKQVAKLGAGIKLDKKQLNPEILRQAAQHVLENWRYQNGAARIRESFNAAGGVMRAVDEIFAFVNHTQSMIEKVS